MDINEQVLAVAALLAKYHDNHDLVANALGWTKGDLKKFKSVNRKELTKARRAVKDNSTKVIPPGDIDAIVEGDPTPPLAVLEPSEADMAREVARSDARLKKGLSEMGLSAKEADEAMALQKFNQGHFRESMDMVSSGVLRMSLRLNGESTELLGRLASVRKRIYALDSLGLQCPDRKDWVMEETALGKQLVEVGRLLSAIQDVWYRGAAQIALIRARYGKNGQGAPKNIKPSFSPTITLRPQEPQVAQPEQEILDADEA